MQAGTSEAGHESRQPSRLGELLECERELTELLADARAEARRRVDKARADVARAEAELEASLEDASGRVRCEIREQSQARVHDILARARERVAHFEGVSEAEVERLADFAFRRLLGTEEHA